VDEETVQITQHIDAERQQLGRNLDEIEDRVKKATDVKHQFDRHTAWILGGAVAGGFLLSRALRKPPTFDVMPATDTESAERINPKKQQPRSWHVERVYETFDNIVEGLIAVASAKLSSFVADVVPGFQEQYHAIEGRGVASSPSLRQVKPNPSPAGVGSAANR
jgi:hypothetical protein